MKKRVTVLLALAALVIVLLALRRHRASDVKRDDSVDPAAGRVAAAGSLDLPETSPSHAETTAPTSRQTSQESFPPGMLAVMLNNADQEKRAVHAPQLARDAYYDRLLLKQERDYPKEEQLRARLMTALGNDPDTLVGELMCSTQFCRVELRGVGKVDVREHWQPALATALEPRGLKFFVISKDDGGNTVTNYYFGRDKSWTVPDFAALGIRPERRTGRGYLP